MFVNIFKANWSPYVGKASSKTAIVELSSSSTPTTGYLGKSRSLDYGFLSWSACAKKVKKTTARRSPLPSAGPSGSRGRRSPHPDRRSRAARIAKKYYKKISGKLRPFSLYARWLGPPRTSCAVAPPPAGCTLGRRPSRRIRSGPSQSTPLYSPFFDFPARHKKKISETYFYEESFLWPT